MTDTDNVSTHGDLNAASKESVEILENFVGELEGFLSDIGSREKPLSDQEMDKVCAFVDSITKWVAELREASEDIRVALNTNYASIKVDDDFICFSSSERAVKASYTEGYYREISLQTDISNQNIVSANLIKKNEKTFEADITAQVKIDFDRDQVIITDQSKQISTISVADLSSHELAKEFDLTKLIWMAAHARRTVAERHQEMFTF